MQPVYWRLPLFIVGFFALERFGQRLLGGCVPTLHRVVAALTQAEQREVGVRLVGCIHALVASALAARVYLAPDATISATAGGDPIFGFSPRAQLVFTFSCAFFVWDVIVCVRDRWGAGFLAHAVACVFCYAAGMQPFLHHIGCFFLCYEASTPLLHLRWFLRATRRRHSQCYARASVAFGFVFGLVRIAFGLPISIAWWGRMVPLLRSDAGQARLAHHGISPTIVALYLVCNIVLNLLNLGWFAKTIQGAMKMSSPSSSSSSSAGAAVSTAKVTPRRSARIRGAAANAR